MRHRALSILRLIASGGRCWRRWASLAVLLAVTGCLSQGEQIPILAWLGPPASETALLRYKELANAGFTHNFSGQPDIASMEKALHVAHSAGIRLLVQCPELRSDPEGTVARFKDHPAVAGYYLWDEPSAERFDMLAEWVARIRAVDDEKFCYINLFPNYASAEQLGTATYQEHVDRFVAEVPVQIITFDHYPVLDTGGVETLRPEWYENLEIIADAARRVDKPFWAFALSVAHTPYPIATQTHMRLQMYSNLAYGAQGLQYFTYWTPVSDVWDFHRAPIESDGTRTEVYERVKGVNREIQRYAGVFLGSHVLQVGHTGVHLPRGTRPFEPTAPITHVETGPTGAVVSLLARDTHRFLVLVNRDLEASLAAEVRWKPETRIHVVTPGGVLKRIMQDNFSAAIAPGDIAVLHWTD